MPGVLLANGAKYQIKKTARRYTNLSPRDSTTESSTRLPRLRCLFRSYAVETSRFSSNSIEDFVVREDRQFVEWLLCSKRLDSAISRVWTVSGQRRSLLSVVFREWAPEKRIISTGGRRHKSRLNRSTIECNAPGCKVASLCLSRRMLQAVL